MHRTIRPSWEARRVELRKRAALPDWYRQALLPRAPDPVRQVARELRAQCLSITSRVARESAS